jgi:hypothetical protein
MANLSRDEMRLYQQARRARIKAEAKRYPDGGTGAQVRPAPKGQSGTLDRPLARMAQAASATSPSRALVPYHPPMEGDVHNPLLVGQAGPGSMTAQGGRPADRSGFSSVATATAAIRAELGQENADLRRGMAELVPRDRDKEMRFQALEAKAVAAFPAPEPAWQKVLMAAAMGVQTYAAMCQAAERDQREGGKT